MTTGQQTAFRWCCHRRLSLCGACTAVLIFVYVQISLLTVRPPGQHEKSSQQLPADASNPAAASTAPLATVDLLMRAPYEVTADMTHSQAEHEYNRYIEQIEVTCPRSMRVGKQEDGGWNMCTEGALLPDAASRGCLVYSFGIGNEWSFDDTISRKFGCHVYAFDPSLRSPDHNRSSLVHFYRLGLSNVDSDAGHPRGWKRRRYSTVLQSFGHLDSVIDYLKIDIEYDEWDALDDMTNSEILHNVKQLGIEVHTKEMFHHRFRHSETKDFVRYYRMLEPLYELGFRKWSSHFNIHGKYVSQHTKLRRTCCFEMVFINMRFIKGIDPF